jgi:hypothetical protein
MKPLKSLRKLVKLVSEKYPAVVSGYVLVGYSFIAVVRMLIKAKKGSLCVEDLFDVFSVLPFMWLLALSIVNLIHHRSKLHDLEGALTREEEQRRTAESQTIALKEAEKALQHQINIPLGIITLAFARLKRSVLFDEVLLDETNDIEHASTRIKTVLADFR